MSSFESIVGKETMGDLARAMERVFPQFNGWASRLVEHPRHYCPFKRLVEYVLADLGGYYMFNEAGMVRAVEGHIARSWPSLAVLSLGAEHNWQSYLVSKNVFDALTLTDPPALWNLEQETKMPFGSVFFLLHRDCLHVEGNPVTVLACTYITPENAHALPGLGFEMDENNRFLCVAYTEDRTVYYNSQPVTPDGVIDLTQDQKEYVSLLDRDTISLRDIEVSKALAPICLQFLTVLNHCDALVENQMSLGFVGKASRGNRKEKVQPAWIGRRFVLPSSYASSAGGHGSPAAGDSAGDSGRVVRPHFRRGHWRGIRHGQGRKLRRMEWIQPCFVNARNFSE